MKVIQSLMRIRPQILLPKSSGGEVVAVEGVAKIRLVTLQVVQFIFSPRREKAGASQGL